jgi:hypothetical protein
LRSFTEVEADSPGNPPVIIVTLARSILEKEGPIVTDSGIQLGTSAAEPPLASTIQIVFTLKRHLVAVEYNSGIMSSGT